jgi:hypothetical protein
MLVFSIFRQTRPRRLSRFLSLEPVLESFEANKKGINSDKAHGGSRARDAGALGLRLLCDGKLIVTLPE